DPTAVCRGVDAAGRMSTGKPFPHRLRRCVHANPEPRPSTSSPQREDREAIAMCRVLNKRKSGIPAGAIYIGRGSKWGNPFRIGPDGDRASVITKYERWLRDQHHLL